MNSISRLWVTLQGRLGRKPHECPTCPSNRCLARLISDVRGTEPRAVRAVQVHPVIAAVIPTHQWWCTRGERAVRSGCDPDGCDCGAARVITYIGVLQARVAELEASS